MGVERNTAPDEITCEEARVGAVRYLEMQVQGQPRKLDITLEENAGNCIRHLAQCPKCRKDPDVIEIRSAFSMSRDHAHDGPQFAAGITPALRGVIERLATRHTTKT